MKRHLVMDLYHGNQTEVVDGPWNEVKDSVPQVKSTKVRVKLNDESETFAYFYMDKAAVLGGDSYFWGCSTKEPMYNVKEWKMLK